MYYKDANGKPYHTESKEITEERLSVNLTQIDKSEFDSIVYSINNPSETETQIIARYTSYYEDIFKNKLIELDYKTDGSTVAMYASIPTSLFYAECQALIKWREAMVNKNYQILNAVKNGEREMPSKEQYISELPLYTTFEL